MGGIRASPDCPAPRLAEDQPGEAEFLQALLAEMPHPWLCGRGILRVRHHPGTQSFPGRRAHHDSTPRLRRTAALRENTPTISTWAEWRNWSTGVALSSV